MIISIQWFNSDGTSDEICLDINKDRISKDRIQHLEELRSSIDRRIDERIQGLRTKADSENVK